MIWKILFFVIAALIGYLLGRWSHYYLNMKLNNPTWAPHHWIYGVMLMLLGLFFYQHLLGQLSFSFGIGHFISDLKDFLQLKFIGPDEEGEKKFWGID